MENIEGTPVPLKMIIIECPFCEWSAAYTNDNKERAIRISDEYSEHLDSHI